MFAFALNRLLVDQIAAELANIDKDRAALFNHIVPKLGQREPPPKHHGCAIHQGRAHSAKPACRVIERQGDIDPVLGVHIGRTGKAAHIGLGPGVGDLGRLGQARGAGGIDIEHGLARRQALADAGPIRAQGAAALQGLGQIMAIALGPF